MATKRKLRACLTSGCYNWAVPHGNFCEGCNSAEAKRLLATTQPAPVVGIERRESPEAFMKNLRGQKILDSEGNVIVSIDDKGKWIWPDEAVTVTKEKP